METTGKSLVAILGKFSFLIEFGGCVTSNNKRMSGAPAGKWKMRLDDIVIHPDGTATFVEGISREFGVNKSPGAFGLTSLSMTGYSLIHFMIHEGSKYPALKLIRQLDRDVVTKLRDPNGRTLLMYVINTACRTGDIFPEEFLTQDYITVEDEYENTVFDYCRKREHIEFLLKFVKDFDYRLSIPFPSPSKEMVRFIDGQVEVKLPGFPACRTITTQLIPSRYAKGRFGFYHKFSDGVTTASIIAKLCKNSYFHPSDIEGISMHIAKMDPELAFGVALHAKCSAEVITNILYDGGATMTRGDMCMATLDVACSNHLRDVLMKISENLEDHHDTSFLVKFIDTHLPPEHFKRLISSSDTILTQDLLDMMATSMDAENRKYLMSISCGRIEPKKMLRMAIENGCVESVRYLRISYGGSKLWGEMTCDAIDIALGTLHPSYEIIDYLLSIGVKYQRKDILFKTNNYNIIDVLIKYGADANVLSSGGRTYLAESLWIGSTPRTEAIGSPDKLIEATDTSFSI